MPSVIHGQNTSILCVHLYTSYYQTLPLKRVMYCRRHHHSDTSHVHSSYIGVEYTRVDPDIVYLCMALRLDSLLSFTGNHGATNGLTISSLSPRSIISFTQTSEIEMSVLAAYTIQHYSHMQSLRPHQPLRCLHYTTHPQTHCW